jgi:hypothetical protein
MTSHPKSCAASANSRLSAKNRLWAIQWWGGPNVGGCRLAKPCCVWASGASTTAGISGGIYNRQLHPEEKQKLAQLQQGQTPEEQQRLADAACALVHCADQMSDSNPGKADALASQQRGAGYLDEQSELRSTGLFVYDPVVDRLSDTLGAAWDWTGPGAVRGAENLGDQILAKIRQGIGGRARARRSLALRFREVLATCPRRRQSRAATVAVALETVPPRRGHRTLIPLTVVLVRVALQTLHLLCSKRQICSRRASQGRCKLVVPNYRVAEQRERRNFFGRNR